ncbi:MAG: response regulator [Candidatus Dadabacteria bacterium]|nr:response regulator [Candidatus Dadabacteria bacterium]
MREEVAPEGKSVVKPTVLVVDDSQTVQKIVSVTLSRQGYRVEVSSNAMQALAKLNDVIPDIIFLDINLPHMDGYQLCKIIKGNELTKEVPVVMLSGKDGFFDKMRGKMVGAADYITKPFEPNALVSAIKKQGIDISSGVM